MGVSSAVGWWEFWQLRILVLSSLFFQYLLFFSIFVRSIPILRRFRVLVWIAYIGGDAVAIYALATLFNRQKKTWQGESSPLEVLWAPVLLTHLGGQPWISAYSLEDNGLWKRHTITLVSQVMVSLYVFCKWWSGEKMLLTAAILFFVLGIIKFAQKPLALRAASFDNMQTSSTMFLFPEADRDLHISSLEEYVEAAKKCIMGTMVGVNRFELRSDYLFVERSAPYSFRMGELKYFLGLEHKHAYNELQKCLRDTFVALYTRVQSIYTYLGLFLMLLLPFLAVTSTVLFAKSHKDGHNKKDIRVTYILFVCTTVLEFLFPFSLLCSASIPCYNSFINKCTYEWHDRVSQCNFMSFCVRKKKPTFLLKLTTFKFLNDFINQHWYIQHVPIAFKITGLVRQHVEYGWKKYIHDVASYRRFSELRGQWALRKHQQLGWSLKMPYDERILVWHIATDICFYHHNTYPQYQQGEATQRSREISNYMVYLLLICPEMLMPGTRSEIFNLASEIIGRHIKDPFDTEEMLALEIRCMPMLPHATNAVSKASKLAKELMELSNKDRWTLIQGVWVEMLCNSASRCRGYLHAKSLGDGGECLTNIWLLLSFMGMETIVDRHQRSDPPEEKQGEEPGGEEEEPSTSGR